MLRSGTEPSLEGLARDYRERAFQFAYRLSGNVDEANDLVQEALYRVARNWDRYDASRPLDSWFFTILRNAFLDGRKRCERRKAVSLDMPLDGGEEVGSFGDIISDGGTDVLEQLGRKETARAVRKVLRGLRRNHQAVLKLRDMEGLRYDEVARVLGVSCGTIRSRISRAREAFRTRSAQLEALAS